MTMRYQALDERLARSAILRLSGLPNFNLVGPGGGIIGGGGVEALQKRIEFQFPPKITSDNRKGTWDEGELRGIEPVAVFRTSGPREITLTWTYIVTGGQWTVQRITDNVHAIRGYFALVRNRNINRNLVVEFQLWQYGGKVTSFRIKSIDVKHSETLVTPCVGKVGDVSQAYPLRTDITVELRLWTQGSSIGTQGADTKVTDLVQPLRGLATFEDPLWY